MALKESSWFYDRLNTRSRDFVNALTLEAFYEEMTYSTYYCAHIVTFPILLTGSFSYLYDYTELLNHDSLRDYASLRGKISEAGYKRFYGDGFSYTNFWDIINREEIGRREELRKEKIDARTPKLIKKFKRFVGRKKNAFKQFLYDIGSEVTLDTPKKLDYDAMKLRQTRLPNLDKSIPNNWIYPKAFYDYKENLKRIGHTLSPSFLHCRHRFLYTPVVYTIFSVATDLATKYPILDVFYHHSILSNDVLDPDVFNSNLNVGPEHIILAIIELDLNPKKWIKLIRDKDDLVQTADLGLNLHELFSCAVNRRVGRGMTRNELDLERLTSKLKTRIVNLSSSSTAYNYLIAYNLFSNNFTNCKNYV